MAVKPYKAYPGSLYGATLENYIENTVIVKEQLEVKKFIQYFLWKLEEKCEYIGDEAEKILHVILDDESLLKKIQIVSITSWKNHVISIFPNNVSCDLKNKNIFEALNYYRSHCDVIFLYLNEHSNNPYQHASIGQCKESENLHYFQQLQENWKQEHEILKKNKIDIMLDEYNELRQDYLKSGNRNCLIRAEDKLKEMQCL